VAAVVVADASVLIALTQIDQLSLLQKLFGQILVPRIILDDLRARHLAKNLGLAVAGTAGVLFAAKQRGFITAVRPLLDTLRARGFRLRKEVYEEILKAAGESEVDE
jgi:predicted nucleic acid-binding protein